MEIYLVGGAVRDELLNQDVHEHDYVVIGETPESMIKQGFKQVGKDFPVFLHPKTQEEYALARKERKTATGYHGFEMDIDQSITLEEDLLRRDLTINAIAKSTSGEYIDPYHGQNDLHDKILRHVSDAFIEDPLRVLRVGRFQAYLPDFSIHPDTMALMTKICANNAEITSLPTERIWLEINKAAKHKAFYLFWETLDQCGCLNALNISITPQFIEDLKSSTLDGVDRLLTPLWHLQDTSGLKALNPPSALNDAIAIIASQKQTIFLANDASDEEILHACKRLDPYRRYERARKMINALPPKYAQQKTFWLRLCQALSEMDIQSIIAGSEPQERQDLIESARLAIIKRLRDSA